MPTATATPAPDPVCSASQASASVGATIAVACGNFGAGERVRLYWGSTENSTIGSFVAAGDGTGQASFKVPTVPGGTYPLYVVGSRGAVLEFSVTVTASVSLSPTSGPIGTRLSITLRGFQPGETVTIRWYVTSSSTRSIAKGVTVGDNGAVRISVRAPQDNAGNHKIEAVGDAGTVASKTFRLTAS